MRRQRRAGTGRPRRTNDPTYPRTIRLTDKEYQDQRDRAKERGMDWAVWVRQMLAPKT